MEPLAPAVNEYLDHASVSSASTSTSASSSLSLSLSEVDESSLSSSAAEHHLPSVPLVLRLFEHLVRHSLHSDTWRYLLRFASDDMLDYLTGRSTTAYSCLEDPFYPGLGHEIRLSRNHPASDEQPEECVMWRVSVANRYTMSLGLDSTEASVTLTRCCHPSRHLPRLSTNAASSLECCYSHCRPIAALGDYTAYLDAAYQRSLLVSADEADLMRGKYHGCRRG